MDTILFELLLYIEIMQRESKNIEQEKMYIACRDLIISFYRTRKYVIENFGKLSESEE